MTDVDGLRGEIVAAVNAADGLDRLEEIRVAELGKKGRVSGLMKQLGGLDPDARREAGQAFNKLKDEVQAAIDARKTGLEADAMDARLRTERIDVSLPPRPGDDGPHPPGHPDH